MEKKEQNSKKIKKESLKKAIRLLKYVKPYRLTFFVGFIFLLITSATGLIFPKLMGELIDASKET